MSRMSRSRRLAGLSLICLIALCAAARQSPAQTGRGSGIRQSAREAEAPEKRLALVVGNGAYQNAGPLNNPANDAADMAATLRALGFEVFYGVNQSLPQMRKLVREFGAKLRQGRGVGLFYYAGHGVQVGGRNFLIPVEADIGSEVETEDVALDVNSVLRHMDAAGNNLNIVILDACRNNPFARSWNRDLSSGGLAQISAPSGMLIAYATCPGCVASDGAGRNGLYTAALLTQMKRPNVDLLRMFQNVRADVKQKSLGRQVPWESNSTTGDFYFVRAGRPAPEAADNSPVEPETATPDPQRHYARGLDNFNKGNFNRALSELDRVIELSPGFAQAYAVRAGIHLLKNNHDGAISDSSRAIELNLNNEMPYIVRGSSYNTKGLYDQGMADFNKALGLNPRSALAYAGRGVSYFGKADYDRAVADLTRAINLSPTNSQAYYNRGNAYFNKKDYDRALADFNKAIEIDPKNAVAYSARALVHEKKGDTARAGADRKKYLELMGIK